MGREAGGAGSGVLPSLGEAGDNLERTDGMMAGYQRQTAVSEREAIRVAGEYLPARIPLERTGGDDHSITLTGGDGTATISAHRHGPDTIVTAETDQLRTSRIDIEVQNYLNQLPYQPEDMQREPTR